MKTKSLQWIFIFMAVFAQGVSAAESLPIENVALPKARENSSSIPFRAPNKTVIASPPVFSAGVAISGFEIASPFAKDHQRTPRNDKLTVKPGQVFTEGGDYRGTALPYLVSDPQPIAYPRWAIRQGWQGKFVIAIEIKTDGTVGRYKVMKSTGRRVLDRVATDAVRSWKFHPAVKNGNIIVTCIEIPVTFELQ